MFRLISQSSVVSTVTDALCSQSRFSASRNSMEVLVASPSPVCPSLSSQLGDLSAVKRHASKMLELHLRSANGWGGSKYRAIESLISTAKLIKCDVFILVPVIALRRSGLIPTAVSIAPSFPDGPQLLFSTCFYPHLPTIARLAETKTPTFSASQ